MIMKYDIKKLDKSTKILPPLAQQNVKITVTTKSEAMPIHTEES